MTFEELDQRFPNGFDDAEITGIDLDYRNRVAMLHLSLRGNAPDGPDSHEYKQAVLRVEGLHYFSIEAPDLDHLFYPARPKVTVDGLPEDPHFPLLEKLKPTLAVGAFYCRFYVHDWNSFIHIAGKAAQFSWIHNTD